MNTESTFKRVMRKSGRKPTECGCKLCQNQCRQPCLGTPEDIAKLVAAGYGDRLAPTKWAAGVMMGVTNKVIPMVQARVEADGWCTFFHDEKCELHDKGLKPTEGRLSHHSLRADNFNPRKSLSWLVAKEWVEFNKQTETKLL